MRFKTQASSCSGSPSKAMLWIEEVGIEVIVISCGQEFADIWDSGREKCLCFQEFDARWDEIRVILANTCVKLQMRSYVCHRVGPFRVPFWVHLGSILGPFWGSFWVHFGSIWGPFGVHFGSILGPFWVHLGSILGPFWVHFGSIFGPFGVHLGSILGSIWGPFWVHFAYCLSGDVSFNQHFNKNRYLDKNQCLDKNAL